MHRVTLLLLCCIVAICAAQNDANNDTIEVLTPVGKIRGSFMTSRLGSRIYSFRGVRYAEPPTGQRRFKQAIPVVAWNDVFDATQEGPSCPQPHATFKSEDCLRLNVYTTQLPSGNSSDLEKSKRPVIVYFHPGGFYGNSGQSFVEGPQFLMDQDIVLVVINYRLASLGFLSTGDSLAPGNLGLKDQVESLRWIQKNIGAFGGDKDCVTITGYSAGGWSVSLHLVSPMTKGLFHRAIAMSGSAIYQKPLPNDQKYLAKKQAELLNCPTDTTGNMLLCLNNKTADEITDTLYEFFEWNGDPVWVWVPVIESDVADGGERFLTAQPLDLIRQGKFYDVPLITGVTKDEFGGGIVFPIEAARNGNTSFFDELNENWDKLAPISFIYERDTPRSKEISDAFKEFYFKGKPISPENSEGVAHLWADGVIGFSVNRFAKVMSQASTKSVYYYEFSYQGRYSHVTWNDTKPYGVVHHDDLLYLFNISFFPSFEKNAPEIPTVERMTAMWANFAKTGEPIPRENEKFANVTWTPFTVENNAYLEIGNELVMKKNLFSDRMNLWERLFPIEPVTRVAKQL